MNINKVHIKNFRCFKDLELNISSVHALIGENGSGKTGVLEAIAFATSGGVPYLHEQDFNNEDGGELYIEVSFDEAFCLRIPDGYTSYDIPCKSILMKAHRREKAASGKALSEPFVIERYAVPIEYASGSAPTIRTDKSAPLSIPDYVIKTTNGYEAPRKTAGSKFQFTTNRLTLQNDTINLPTIFYFDRGREDQAKIGFNSLLTRIAKDLNWRYRKDWDQAEIETKWNDFYELVISTVQDKKKDRIIQPLRDKMKSIVGDEFNDLEMGILDIEQPFSKTFFSRREKTNQIDQTRFGSGISILLAYFLLEIISSISKEGAIFLIDEPELHLHPQVQFKLFKEFAKSNFQTIYTTQSDCLVNIAEWTSISRFKHTFEVSPKEPILSSVLEGIKVSDHLEEIKKWHQQQSIFFREDNQLFFARKCLLVEGPAEKYGLPILADKLGVDINALTILSCNGKTKIPYYQLLCKAFEIPFFTLFDLDGLKVNEGDNIRPAGWADATAISTIASSFEVVFGIGGSADHKTSTLLQKLDTIKVEDIPEEISNILNSIQTWSKIEH